MAGEKGQFWGAGPSRSRGFGLLQAVAAMAACWVAFETPAGERPRPARRQAAPPPTVSDAGGADAFFSDAFATLRGDRPDFGPRTAAPQSQPARATEAAAGFRWSNLVSEGTLTDEIKDLKGVAAAATSRPTEFKGGGYDRAREAFSTLALAFALLAEHDQDVRWQDDAATARDLFARIGFNCTVGTDQSLAEARLGLVDLESLLAGEGPRRQSDRDEDFRWSQVASRSALMKRLEAAEAAILGGLTGPQDTAADGGRVLHEAEIVAAIAEVIRMPDFEDHDDETYRGYCEQMRDAAVKLRAACEKGDAEAARAASGLLKKSCDTCHGDYRG